MPKVKVPWVISFLRSPLFLSSFLVNHWPEHPPPIMGCSLPASSPSSLVAPLTPPSCWPPSLALPQAPLTLFRGALLVHTRGTQHPGRGSSCPPQSPLLWSSWNWQQTPAPLRPEPHSCSPIHISSMLTPPYPGHSSLSSKTLMPKAQPLCTGATLNLGDKSFGWSKRGSPGGSVSKESACNAGDLGSIPGVGRSLEEEILQYSCLENSMDREAWWAAVHGVTKSQTRLSD